MAEVENKMVVYPPDDCIPPVIFNSKFDEIIDEIIELQRKERWAIARAPEHRVQPLLEDGWEPFAVTEPIAGAESIWLRRKEVPPTKEVS